MKQVKTDINSSNLKNKRKKKTAKNKQTKKAECITSQYTGKVAINMNLLLFKTAHKKAINKYIIILKYFLLNSCFGLIVMIL